MARCCNALALRSLRSLRSAGRHPGLRDPLPVVGMDALHPVGQAQAFGGRQLPAAFMIEESEAIPVVHFPQDDAGLAG